MSEPTPPTDLSYTVSAGKLDKIRETAVPVGVMASPGLEAVSPAGRVVTRRAVEMTEGLFSFAERSNQKEPDLQFIEGSEEAEIEDRLLAARDLEHALLFTRMLLDADLTTATRSRAAEDLEPLITPPSPREREPWVRYKAIGQCLRDILFAHPLPETADVAQALKLCDSLHLSSTRGLLLNIRDSQADIREVCNAWDAIPNEIFDTEQSERARFRAVAVREGLFHDLAFTTVRERTDSFVSDRLKIPAIAAFKNSRGILERWVAPLRRVPEPPPIRQDGPRSSSFRPARSDMVKFLVRDLYPDEALMIGSSTLHSIASGEVAFTSVTGGMNLEFGHEIRLLSAVASLIIELIDIYLRMRHAGVVPSTHEGFRTFATPQLRRNYSDIADADRDRIFQATWNEMAKTDYGE